MLHGNQVNDNEDIQMVMAVQDYADEHNLAITDDAEYKRISEMYISQRTRNSYQGCNKRLLLWLDSHEPQCVATYAKEALQSVWEQRRQAGGGSSKTKNSAVIKRAFELVREANEEKQPILLSDITVKMFVNFLFAMGRNNTDGDQKFMSKSGCGSYRSALKDMYRQCGNIPIDDKFEKELSTKLKGLLRAHAEEKESTGKRLSEGKDPMSFALYKLLCKKMMEDGSKSAVFAHAFLTLTWNLVCRSKNTVYIHRNHIAWATDSMSIQFAHMKTDMEGSHSAQKRHVYANPHCVPICAVTAVAKYLAVFEAKTSGMLFDKGSYGRFGQYLGNLVKSNKTAVEQLGVNIEDIGVHSIRKGAATYCCAGTTAAPHIAAVCNRAGWTMGKVKDTYIQYAEAGDQHVGRVVAGLSVLDKSYACTPPYFRVDDGEIPNSNTCTTDDVNIIVSALFQFRIETSFRPVAVACAAALCYGREALDKAQPKQWYVFVKNMMLLMYMHLIYHYCTMNRSMIRNTSLFRTDATLNKVIKAITVTHSWDDDGYWKFGVLTGIPPHIVTYVNQERIIKEVNTTINTFSKALFDDLNARQFGGGNLTIELLHDRITKPLTNRIEHFESLMKNAHNITNESVGVGLNQLQEGHIETTIDNFFLWNRDGRTHLLPEEFALDPAISPLLLWEQWHRGMTLSGGQIITPLKNIQAKDYPSSSRMFKRMRRFCKAIDDVVQVNGSEAVNGLVEKYNANIERLKEKGVLLPSTTPTGRRRTRNSEFSWSYFAQQYENQIRLETKARESNQPLEEVIAQDREMTNARKKRERERRRSALTQDGGSSDNGQQRRRMQENVGIAAIFDGAQMQHAATRLLM